MTVHALNYNTCIVACKMAKFVYFREGKIEESIHYLEMFVEVAESINDDTAVSRASSCLGAMFNSLVRVHVYFPRAICAHTVIPPPNYAHVSPRISEHCAGNGVNTTKTKHYQDLCNY